MARYLVLWELDSARVPVDPKERAGAWTMLMNMVKQDIERGFTKDWGVFPGELGGFFVAEANEIELMMVTGQYAPYVTFKVHPVASVSQVDDFLAALGA